MKKKALFNEFPPVETKSWEDQLKKDLKGADYEKTLFTKTRENISIRPFYREEDRQAAWKNNDLQFRFLELLGDKKDNNWRIRQDILVDSISNANAKALRCSTKGVDSIGFLFSNQTQISVKDIENLMKDIHAEKLEVNFMCGSAAHKVLAIYEELVLKYKRKPEIIYGSVDFDPFMAYAFRGKFCQTEAYAFKHAKQLVHASKALPNFKVLGISGNNLRNAGATIVQELAFSLAQGVEYIDRLTDMGLSVEKIANRIKFNFGVGSNYFMEIAKLRAARILWARVLSAFGLANANAPKMNIHSVSVLWNKSIYDAHVNILRSSTEGMSAVLGGTDSLNLLPYDISYQWPSLFAERIARNQQLILREESFLNKVLDPSAGSYYLESLTSSLVDKAWNLFLLVEDLGGYIAALKAEFVQNEIEAEAVKSKEAMAKRKEIVLGSNQYPNFSEHQKEMLNPEVFEALDLSDPAAEIRTLKQSRLSQGIERIRQKMDIYALKNIRPKAFMLPFGNKTMRKIRAQFACNYFACAGFDVEDNSGFDDINEGIEAAIEARADIVVLCSSDSEYPAFAEAVFDKLQYHALLVVAGNPKPFIQEIEEAGIKRFIHAQSDIVKDLRKFQYELGID
jgi:methylmalonyl-CoA mutase